MPNFSDWIPVVDNFIKIGVPSLITGVTAYKVAKFQFRANIEKFKFERRSDLLLKAAEGYEAYFQSYFRYANLLMGLAHAENSFQNEAPEVMAAVAAKIHETRMRTVELRKQMNEEMHKLTSAQSKLMFLEDETCRERADALQLAIFGADTAFKFNGTTYDVTDFMTHQTAVAEARKNFYTAMREASANG